MPRYSAPFKISPQVELISKKFLTFEDAADLLANAVGSRKFSSNSAGDLLRASESLEAPGVSLVSFQSIEQIAQSLREEWTTWPKKLRLKRSPFLLVTGRLEVNLHPMYLGDLGLGLRGQAGTLLHRWVEELQCIPLGFKELTPAGKHGAVVATSPFIHFYMHFKAVGFAPKKGDWLRGRVCQVQIEGGMNVTLVGLSNCHIKSEHLPRALRFCRKTQKWMGLNDETQNGQSDAQQPVVYVKVVDEVVVDKFQQSGKMFEFNCRLGYPEKDVPRQLKEAQAAEAERELKKAERKKSVERPDGKAVKGGSTSSKVKVDEEETSASKKKKKQEEEEEDATSYPPSKKKKKKPEMADEADEQETTASFTSEKKKKPPLEEETIASVHTKKKKTQEVEDAAPPSTRNKKKRSTVDQADG